MTRYREILRLTAMGLPQRAILKSVQCSQKTVVKVQHRARELKISWLLDDSMADAALEEKLFPKTPKVSPTRQMPDFNHIHRELLRNGVNKKLLWTEYLETCRQSGSNPLMYSQFCYYIQQDEQRRRATMHITRKPGEQIEVDWAGDPAYIVDPDTGEATKAHLFVGVLSYSQYPYVEAFVSDNRLRGLRHTSICSNTSAALLEFSSRIIARRQSFVMGTGTIPKSMRSIARWQSITIAPLFRPESGLPRTNRTQKVP